MQEHVWKQEYYIDCDVFAGAGDAEVGSDHTFGPAAFSASSLLTGASTLAPVPITPAVDLQNIKHISKANIRTF